MEQSVKPLSLRERKKLQTREAIRRAAVELIEANGYANTTVEQIADAAEVSRSTFFRYFSSKQAVLVNNDIDEFAASVLASQPADIPTVQAFRRTLEITRSALSEDEWREVRRRRRLVLSIPELRELQLEEHLRTAVTMTEAECRRLGRDPDDFEVRLFFGALNGAMLAALDGSKRTRRDVSCIRVLRSGYAPGSAGHHRQYRIRRPEALRHNRIATASSNSSMTACPSNERFQPWVM